VQAWLRAVRAALDKFRAHGAWAGRPPSVRAAVFADFEQASVVCGSAAKPLAAKFAPKFEALHPSVVRAASYAPTNARPSYAPHHRPSSRGGVPSVVKLPSRQSSFPAARAEGGGAGWWLGAAGLPQALRDVPTAAGVWPPLAIVSDD
jgi:hypothetical protein